MIKIINKNCRKANTQSTCTQSWGVNFFFKLPKTFNLLSTIDIMALLCGWSTGRNSAFKSAFQDLRSAFQVHSISLSPNLTCDYEQTIHCHCATRLNTFTVLVLFPSENSLRLKRQVSWSETFMNCYNNVYTLCTTLLKENTQKVATLVAKPLFPLTTNFNTCRSGDMPLPHS